VNTEFRELFEVRDTEIDMQGVVSNTNYAIYFQHARHKYMETIGINFSDYANNKQYFTLLSSQTNFIKPLFPKDTFYVTVEMNPAKSKLRMSCYQQIKRCTDDCLIAEATNLFTCINHNEPNPRKKYYIPEMILKAISEKHPI